MRHVQSAIILSSAIFLRSPAEGLQQTGASQSSGTRRTRHAKPPLQPAAWAGQVPFGPSDASEPLSMNGRFEAWPALNDATLALDAGVSKRSRLNMKDTTLSSLFAGDTLQAKLSRALASRQAVDRKEFFESWEFFSRCRSSFTTTSSKQPQLLVDVAGGHGMLGLLVAVFQWKRFDKVVIADTKQPKAFEKVLDAGLEVAPWIASRLKYVSGPDADFMSASTGDSSGSSPSRILSPGCAVACVHGCNALTDSVLLEAARARAESIVVMPCCYGGVAKAAPPALRRSLGVALAADVERTYQLEREYGYDVGWRALPSMITPLNRILTARRKKR